MPDRSSPTGSHGRDTCKRGLPRCLGSPLFVCAEPLPGVVGRGRCCGLSRGCGCPGGGRDGRNGLGDVDLGHLPVEEIVGALALQLTDLREVGRVGQNGVEELPCRGVGVVDLCGQTVVEGLELVVVEPLGQNSLSHEDVVGEDVAHVAGIGVEFVDDFGHDDHVDRIVDALHLDKLHVDGVGIFERSGDRVGEEPEFGIGQVVEVDHLAIRAQGFAHGLSLFVVPLALFGAPGESCGHKGQQSQREEQSFHVCSD